MDSQFFLVIALVIFSALFLAAVFFRLEPGRPVYLWFRIWLFLAVIILSLGIGLRSYESKHLPLTNLYESLLIFAWFLSLIPLVFKKLPVSLLRFALLLAGAAILSASLLPHRFTEAAPLLPALKSHWLAFHVLTCFSAYSAFAVAFGSALLYLVPAFRGSLSLETLENITSTSISLGFPLLTIGIVTGAVWANQAWGTYWSWDPKETWSLITWLIYAVFLHARFAKGFRGRRAALIAVFGFISVIFTYLGVNLILSGLHSYAS
ncbi:MAG: cytochrome c biogenesis protein CcsA [Proteobacteria bacterium]|nr:cytochrome c biogenesis protein CcsA [Pseudomonadota bacterium]